MAGIKDKKKKSIVVGIAQWIVRGSVNQRVAGLIPNQGTCLGCGPGPWLGDMRGNQLMFLSLSFFFLSLLSKKILKKRKKSSTSRGRSSLEETRAGGYGDCLHGHCEGLK